MAYGSHRLHKRTHSVASGRAAVSRAEAYLRAHLGTPVSVSRLSQIVGVSERALRDAFCHAYGMGPHRFMLTDRLEAVRRAFLAASATPTTVTAIATAYGFYELGRFAGMYKQAFGESPSETLRGLGRKSAEHTSEHERAPDACTS